MTIEKTITLYAYDELSEKAKERARDWWLSCRDEFDYEYVLEDFANMAEILGIEFKTHEVRLMSGKTRKDRCIWWSLGYMQSDFAAFDGWARYAKSAAKAIREEAPEDSRLHAIADALQDVQARNFYQLRASVTHHHYYGLQVEVTRDDGREPTDDAEAIFKGAMRDLCQWLYDQLREQDEWLCSEENIADAMAANEYTFREDGRRED